MLKTLQRQRTRIPGFAGLHIDLDYNLDNGNNNRSKTAKVLVKEMSRNILQGIEEQWTRQWQRNLNIRLFKELMPRPTTQQDTNWKWSLSRKTLTKINS